MKEIVLKDLASVYLLKNFKAISWKDETLLSIFILNNILNLNACICSNSSKSRFIEP